MKVKFFYICGLFLITIYSQNGFAAPGDLDPTFGTNGKVIISHVNGLAFDTFTGSGFIPTKIAVQTDGKILIVGNQNAGISINLIVARVNSNGTLDNTFGTNGVVTTGFGDLLALATDVIIQPDGKIIVTGIASAGFGSDINFAIARYNANGSLDSSFNGNGRVTTSFDGNLLEGAFAVALQTDGKIVVAGSSLNETTNESRFAISRYNTNGSLDSSFDGDGKLLLQAGSVTDTSNVADALAIQSDGKIIVGGQTGTDTTSGFGLVRLMPNGSFDTTFDIDGKVQTQINGFGVEVIRSLVIQTDGNIIAVGQADVDSDPSSENDDFALTRYNHDGSLDTTFSLDGKLTISFGNDLNFEQAYDVVIQTDGKIIVGGFSGTISDTGTINTSAALARLNNNGDLDIGFGNNGLVTTGFSDPVNLGSGLAIQTDGKIVIGGASGTNDLNAADFSPLIARYEGGSVTAQPTKPIFDFDGDSKTDISIFRPSLGQWWYLRSSDFDNRAFAFGTSSDTLVPADYTGDGKTDIAFFRPSSGEWFILRSEDSSFYGFPFGAAGDIPAPGDFDGDGKADPAVFRPSTATWFIQRSSDNGTTIQGFGIPEDKPTVADFDGDGKDDIAIFRPSNSQWWQLRSSAGTIAYAFGTTGDKTVQGDYTGDGKADVAIFRPSSGSWFVLRSEDSSFYSVPFGLSTDIPTPGDYDGDGKMDTAVFRPSTNTWFYQGSTSGSNQVGFGQAGDIPVPNVYSVP